MATWSLGEPVLTLGSISGENDAFSPIRSLAVGPDHRVYLLLPQEHRVAVFSEDGSIVGSIGREGDGPGEFSFPVEIGFVGDSLWVLDPRAQRINYFHNLEFVNSEASNRPRDVHPERRPREVAVLEGGGVLMVTDSQSPIDPPVTTTPSLILVQGEGHPDTLATYSTDHTAGFIIRRFRGEIAMMRSFPQPFTFAGLWAVSPGGTQVALVDQDRISSGSDESSFGVTALRPTGDTVYSTRIPFPTMAIPSSHVEAVLSELGGDNFTDEEVREALFLPTHYPPVSAVLIADDGSVWIGREALPVSPLVWNVLSPDGEWIANLTTPEGFDLRAVSGNHVWGLTQDELDVPYVVRRPILRPQQTR